MTILTGRAIAIAASSTVALFAPSTAAAQVRSYDIPAQSAQSGIVAFGRQADVQIVAPRRYTASKRTNAVRGTMSIDAALAQLLAGTGLVARATGPQTYMIVPAAAQTSNAAPPIPPTNEADPDPEIVVTGTNIRGTTNPTSPVKTFDRKAITNSGASSIEDFTRLLPQNLATQSSLSFTGNNPYDTFNQNAASAPDLRGLGAESTLSLLNGRRMPGSGGSGFADLSVLPLQIIDSVQVLSDGASAIYGADAVGGVVNIATRREYEGFEFQSRVGSVTSGSKQDYQLSVAAGTSWTSGNALLSGFYGKDEPLRFAERSFARPEDLLTPNGFLIPGEETFNVYGRASQALGPVQLSVDGLFTQQETALLAPNGTIDNLDNHVVMLNTNLNAKLFDGFFADIFVDYSENIGTRAVRTSATALTRVEDQDRLLTLEGRLGGTLFPLPGGNVALALGGGARREAFTERASNSTLPVDAARWVYAAYGELLAPIVGEGNAMPFINRLDLSVAGRFETTESFGDSFTPKIGLRWKPIDSISIRGGYSRSFRAPTLRNTNGRRQAIFYGYNNPGLGSAAEDPRLLPGLVYGLSFAGAANPDLKTENARIWNIGIDIEPASGLKLGATYFNVDYRNRILSVNPHRVLGIAPLNIAPLPEFAALVDTTPDVDFIRSILADNGTNYTISNFLRNVARNRNDPTLVPRAEDVRVVVLSGLQNIAVSKVSGIDFDISYSVSSKIGELTFDLSGTRLLTNRFQSSPTAVSLDRLDLVYRPIDLKLRGSASLQSGGFGLTAAVSYADSYKDDVNQPQRDAAGNVVPRAVDAWTTIDLGVSYAFEGTGSPVLDKTRLALNVRNLFDADPPRLQIGDGFNFDTANAHPLGRYVSFTLTSGF